MTRPGSPAGSRWIRFLVRLHPPAWRARYGDEFAALLTDTGTGPRHSLDVLRAAAAARLRPAGHLHSPAARMRSSAAVVCGAFATLTAVSVLFAKLDSDGALSRSAGTDPIAAQWYDLYVTAGFISVPAMLIGGLVLAIAALRRSDPRARLRTGFGLAAPAIAGLCLSGAAAAASRLPQDGPGFAVVAAAGVAATTAGTCGVATAVTRSRAQGRPVRFALWCGAIAIAWLAVSAVGAIGYRMRLPHSVSGTIGFAVYLAVMAIGIVVAATSLARGLHAAARTRPSRGRWRRWTGRIAAATGLSLLTLAMSLSGYVGLAAARHLEPVALPAPTGEYPVGRAMTEWTDPDRQDPLAPAPGSARELSVWIWYPAADSTAVPAAPYAPAAWAGLHFPGMIGWGETDFGVIDTHSSADAPAAAGRFPVAVLEPGLGLSAPQLTTVAENLASHGFIVAGVTPTYSANLTVLDGTVESATPKGNPAQFTATDGDRLVDVWARDAVFAAHRITDPADNRFAAHVDDRQTVYLGHSLGGAASLQACAWDARCRAAVDLDGTPYGEVVDTGLSSPFLILGSDNSCTTGFCRPVTTEDEAARDAALTLRDAADGRAQCLGIKGTGHFNFTDYGVYYLADPLAGLVPVGSIDGRRALEITNRYVSGFLDQAVTGRADRLLDGTERPYPEVEFQCGLIEGR